MSKRRMSPLYKKAVQWIADNDETASREVTELENLISVVMTADLFDVPENYIAQEVVAIRLKADAAKEAA